MRLFEYQAKKIFKEIGIPIPISRLIRVETDLPIDFYPSVFKAQVLTGGRGKAGAIKIVDYSDDARHVFSELMAIKVKNEFAQAVLIEEKISIQKEYYLSLVIDKQKSTPIFIVSHEGGVEIESVAKESQEKILKLEIDYLIGLQEFEIRRVAGFIGTPFLDDLRNIMNSMYRIFKEKNATLIEINPLAETKKGLIALDAKMILDDKASFRHQEIFEEIEKEQIPLEFQAITISEKMAQELEITYVPLKGDIGIISDGAGTGMLTLDLIVDYGGQAANFCELGGLGDANRMYEGLQVITANPDVKVILVSLIGGITRMDDMAQGISRFVKTEKYSIPIIVRMCGTQEDEGKRILKDLNIFHDRDLAKVVKRAVETARI